MDLDEFYDMVETTKSFEDLETTNFQSIKDDDDVDEYGVECTDIINF